MPQAGRPRPTPEPASPRRRVLQRHGRRPPSATGTAEAVSLPNSSLRDQGAPSARGPSPGQPPGGKPPRAQAPGAVNHRTPPGHRAPGRTLDTSRHTAVDELTGRWAAVCVPRVLRAAARHDDASGGGTPTPGWRHVGRAGGGQVWAGAVNPVHHRPGRSRADTHQGPPALGGSDSAGQDGGGPWHAPAPASGGSTADGMDRRTGVSG